MRRILKRMATIPRRKRHAPSENGQSAKPAVALTSTEITARSPPVEITRLHDAVNLRVSSLILVRP
jgi:hypothetical protein